MTGRHGVGLRRANWSTCLARPQGARLSLCGRLARACKTRIETNGCWGGWWCSASDGRARQGASGTPIVWNYSVVAFTHPLR